MTYSVSSSFNFKDAFGFHTQSMVEQAKPHPKKSYIGWNLLNIIGYVPVLGILSALGRLFVINNQPEDYSFGFLASAAFRAFVETIGGGVLFLIPDIIVTIGRVLSKYKITINQVEQESQGSEPLIEDEESGSEVEN